MFRNLRDLLSLICLPILVIVVAMWIRSYTIRDRLTYRSLDNQDCHLRSDCGHVTWFWTTPLFPNRRQLTELTATYLPRCSWMIKAWESVGFHHEYEILPGDGLHGDVARSLTMIPYWFLFLLAGVAPGWRYIDNRRRLAKA